MAKKIVDNYIGKIFKTASLNDIINSLDNVKYGIRVTLNTNDNTFLYGDMSVWVHPMMIRSLVEIGYFSSLEKNIDIKTNSQLADAIKNGIIKPIYNFGITNKEDGAKAFLEDQYTQEIKYNNGLFSLMLRPDSDPFKSDYFKQVMAKYKEYKEENKNDVNNQINEVLRIAGINLIQ